MKELEIGVCCGCFLDLNLPELIELAGRHGFPTITVRPLTYQWALEAGWTEARLRRLLADARFRVTMIDCLTKGLPGLPPRESFDAELRARLTPDAINPLDEADVFRCGEALEAPWVNVSHFMGEVVPFDEMAEAITGVCRRAATRGLGIALEFNPNSGLPDIGYAQRISEAAGDNCAITLDFWHLDRSDGGMDDLRRLPPGALAGIQLDDRNRAASPVYVPMMGRNLPGEGELPLHEWVRAALANSPDITAEVEVFIPELQAMAPDDAAARITQAIDVWRIGL